MEAQYYSHLYWPGVALDASGVGDDYRALARERGGKVLHDPAIIEPHHYEYLAPPITYQENAASVQHVKELRHLRWLKRYAEHGAEIREKKRLAYLATKAAHAEG